MQMADVVKYSGEGFNCAQIVCASAAKKLGITEKTAYLMAACFGGGMDCGEVCGAFSGGLMAIGLKYGNGVSGDVEARNRAKEKAQEFRTLFIEEYQHIRCKELLGYDF
ncbi:MAG: C-GCAxxG-C-C family protein, partial [Oscillospiraceae bacterium]